MGTYPKAYHHLLTPATPKRDKGQDPLDFRLLALYSATYRVEAGAWFDHIFPWFVTTLHPSVHGAIPGHETLEVS